MLTYLVFLYKLIKAINKFRKYTDRYFVHAFRYILFHRGIIVFFIFILTLIAIQGYILLSFENADIRNLIIVLIIAILLIRSFFHIKNYRYRTIRLKKRLVIISDKINNNTQSKRETLKELIKMFTMSHFLITVERAKVNEKILKCISLIINDQLDDSDKLVLSDIEKFYTKSIFGVEKKISNSIKTKNNYLFFLPLKTDLETIRNIDEELFDFFIFLILHQDYDIPFFIIKNGIRIKL